jgi:beta-lactamase class A
LSVPHAAITGLAGDDGVISVPQVYHLLASRRPAGEQLLRQLEALERGWGGVLGVYVYDLAADRAVASLHQETVFSGASVLKAAIMLHAYAELPSFSQEQDDWLRQMIVDSDNSAANVLLAASVGGSTPNDAARGALHMSAMLANLGLQHTYLRTPYAEEDEPPDLSGLDVSPGAAQEGAPPYTVADPWLRATPAEIGRLFLWIERCAQGRGPLPARCGATLTPARCREMIGLLEQNGDRSRLVAGVPEGTRVAHKSGWIGDTQGDVGIVRSSGGDYLVAVFVYRDVDAFDSDAAAATIAEVSGVVYRSFNP